MKKYRIKKYLQCLKEIPYENFLPEWILGWYPNYTNGYNSLMSIEGSFGVLSIAKEEKDEVKEGYTLADAVYDRFLWVGADLVESYAPVKLSRDYNYILTAFVILAIHYFSEDVRKVILLQHYENNMYQIPKRKPFRLNKYQKVTLMYVFNRAGIRLPFHAIPEFLTLSMLAKHLPKRIIHRKDSMIKAILQQAKKEKNNIAYLYKMVKKLSLDQQIHLLLLIPEKDYTKFKELVHENTQSTIQKLESGELSGVHELKALSAFKYGTPDYICEVDFRRGEIKESGKYPAILDTEFQI